MTQILHILCKDIRRMWPYAVIIVVTVILHAFFDVRSAPVSIPETARANSLSNLSTMVLPLAIWFSIAMLIIQEALPGDRQFWLTRPYYWPTLLASKILFIVLFVNLPLFLSDCYILTAEGFPVIGVFPELMLRQLHMTLLFILPALAIATLSASLAQFLLGWFVVLLAFILQNILVSFILNSPSVGFALDGSGVVWSLAVFVCAIVLWQYATRKTTIARLVSIAVVVGAVPIFVGLAHFADNMMPAQPRPLRPNTSNVRVSYDLQRRVNTEGMTIKGAPEGFVFVRLPLKVKGLPPNTLLRGTGQVAIDVAGDQSPAKDSLTTSSIELLDNGYYVHSLMIDRSKSGFLLQQTVNLHTLFQLEVVNDKPNTSMPVAADSFLVPGSCRVQTFSASDRRDLTFKTGLTPVPETAVRLVAPPIRSTIDVVAVLHTTDVPWGFSPISNLGTLDTLSYPLSARLTFTTRTQVAEFDQKMDLSHVRLSDFPFP